MNPLICFLRARLQRRLFAWFGATIFFTGVLVALVMGASQAGRGGWDRELSQLRAFVGGRFERVWDAPAERDELAAAIARDLDLGVTLEDAEGHTIRGGAPCTIRPLITPVLRAGRTLGQVTICADHHRSRAGNLALPLLVVGAVLWGASGMLARRLARPIVEVARVAEALGAGNYAARVRVGRHHHGEAIALASSINTMAERIERTMAEQRALLAAVSHELRTPLARIRLLTEMARDGGGAEKSLDELDREVMEIDALVGELLASSRLDFAVLSKSTVDAAEAAGRALERAGVDPSLLIAEGDDGAEPAPMRVDADATLLARALANLIDNAKKHGGGVEALRVRRAGEAVVFEVEDRGAGVTPGEEAQIFEPFYRRSENGSLGLGLALVKRIAEAHGGDAFAENRIGGGARVGLRLPASRG